MASNLDIWNALSRTDPKQTKGFKRAGGFSGTAVKPIYCTQRMTEQFGPCGKGWGIEKPDFQVVPGDNREVLVYCTVAMWWNDSGTKNTVYGVGGDKAVTHIKANPQYNKPERWENDDEAFKKAFTDAIGNAMKHLGMSADIHMGLFDDSKYVRELEKEFSEDKKSGEPGNQQRGPEASRSQAGNDDPFAEQPAQRKNYAVVAKSKEEFLNGVLKHLQTISSSDEIQWVQDDNINGIKMLPRPDFEVLQKAVGTAMDRLHSKAAAE